MDEALDHDMKRKQPQDLDSSFSVTSRSHLRREQQHWQSVGRWLFFIFALSLLYIYKRFGISVSQPSDLSRPTWLSSYYGGTHPEFSQLENHCASIPPISTSEFLSRQQNLVHKMHQSGISAYIAEPGSNAMYFANISIAQWHPSERPFLIIITPDLNSKRIVSEQRSANVTILAPRFEIERAKKLVVPYDDDDRSSTSLKLIDWAEDEDPFVVLYDALSQQSAANGKIVLDDGMRKFVADGLAHAGFSIKEGGYPVEIARLREQKSAAELDIMRCANEATVLAIRAVKRQLKPGIAESTGRAYIEQAMTKVGLTEGGGLVLFGENAALPHGSGTDRKLQHGDFILMDVGGKLHGYTSDITRTFTISSPSQMDPRHLELWYVVHAAQKAALKVARRGVRARDVDRAAREIIRAGMREFRIEMRERRFGWSKGEQQDYDEKERDEFDVNDYFTHRLGHGIGLDGHESPYLVGGISNKAVLATNNTFSDEPGIYILNEVGIRLEDCFYVSEHGETVLLTEGVGGFSVSPWDP